MKTTEEDLVTAFIRDVLLFRSYSPHYRKAGRLLWIFIAAMPASLLIDYL